MKHRVWALEFIAVVPAMTFAGPQTNLLAPIPPIPHCGEIEAQPYADPHDAGRRICPASTAHTYVPHHQGLGYDLLNQESEGCFVPDQEYRLLDEIVDAVSQSVHYDPKISDPQAQFEQARTISRRISQELTRRGFALWIPTETLGDALIDRNQPTEVERHVFDCDTGSFIFLTVSQNLGASTSLVEVTLPSGAGHNYVQWRLNAQGTTMNWDTNQQGECITPPGLPNYQGKPMTDQQTRGYAISLRAGLWSIHGAYDRATQDFHTAMQLYPQAPGSYNNYAWMIATRDFPDRKPQIPEALKSAQKATTINRTPNYLDTLGCVYALMGQFDDAVRIETEAFAHSGGDPAFKANLDKFTAHTDCTGEP